MSSAKSPRGARAKSPQKSPEKAPEPNPAPAEASPGEAAATPDPVPSGIRGLVDLFQGALCEVRFPDVDREVLEGACDAVRAADAEVTRLFAELEAAQVALADERQKLGKLAERGLAYARVFAGDDESLNAQLDALDLGTPKKPGRKAKPQKASIRPKKPKAEPTPALVTDADTPESEKRSA